MSDMETIDLLVIALRTLLAVSDPYHARLTQIPALIAARAALDLCGYAEPCTVSPELVYKKIAAVRFQDAIRGGAR